MTSESVKCTPEEIEWAADTMRRSFKENGNRHATPFFYAICETNPSITVELIVASQITDKVLMTEREQDDPYFPAGMWHIPGTMMEYNDMKSPYFEDALDHAAHRVAKEIQGTRVMRVLPLTRMGLLYQPPRLSARGPELSFFYGAYSWEEEPNVGQLFGVDEMPKNMLENHRDIIRRAPEALFNAHMSLRSV
jgi:ADP-ribose pyrophosphatase YjhB (NUDIX family)